GSLGSGADHTTLLALDGSRVMTGPLDMGGQNINNIGANNQGLTSPAANSLETTSIFNAPGGLISGPVGGGGGSVYGEGSLRLSRRISIPTSGFSALRWDWTGLVLDSGMTTKIALSEFVGSLAIQGGRTITDFRALDIAPLASGSGGGQATRIAMLRLAHGYSQITGITDFDDIDIAPAGILNTATTRRGVRVRTLSPILDTFTNVIALEIEAQTGGTNRWNIRSLGVGIHVLEGATLIGANAAPASGYALELRNHFLLGASYQDLGEIATPANPATNRARLYAKDDGAGKTQLAVRFPTGAEVILAAEP
ncbi:MAG: hypothetical protein ACE5KW_02455, partial [Dehalococcoidia bacterium]